MHWVWILAFVTLIAVVVLGWGEHIGLRRKQVREGTLPREDMTRSEAAAADAAPRTHGDVARATGAATTPTEAAGAAAPRDGVAHGAERDTTDASNAI